MKLFSLAGLFASILSPLRAQERKAVAITESRCGQYEVRTTRVRCHWGLSLAREAVLRLTHLAAFRSTILFRRAPSTNAGEIPSTQTHTKARDRAHQFSQAR